MVAQTALSDLQLIINSHLSFYTRAEGMFNRMQLSDGIRKISISRWQPNHRLCERDAV